MNIDFHGFIFTIIKGDDLLEKKVQLSELNGK